MTDTHPRHRLADALNSPVRLSIVAALSRVEKADFKVLRDTIEVSDSALSKQLTMLEDAGYVSISKGRSGRRPRTWVRLSRHGRDALDRHLAALQDIATLTPPTTMP
ncbi:winged helix-turn-helix domain-containing protein [Actinocatenispora comari]|uniref:MarR family transcriptional regulator n=1 Tax=Actinocatenispora comari TaxID=2807577 RepID=A0A8J4A8P5_9ACTN|nr:transcriptional regulator [Actinocatenispora comari]GIL25152.1 MarR family transcriptional regulator [Actinocatenispora comari]